MNCWDKEIFYLNNDINIVIITDEEFEQLNGEINDGR
jgi:hypothetical protein